MLQPLREIADICHERGALFHTDAAQAVGKVPMSVNDLGVRGLSCTATCSMLCVLCSGL